MPPLRKRVLKEEEYEEHLESIINRDFFPDVKRLRKALNRTVDADGSLTADGSPPNSAAASDRVPTTVLGGAEMRSAPRTPLSVLEEEHDGEGSSVVESDTITDHQDKAAGPENNKSSTADEDGFPIPSIKNLRLDEFQAIHVTEDDLSFERLLFREKKQRAARRAWMEIESNRHNKALEDAVESLGRLADADRSGLLINGQAMRQLDTEAHRGQLMNRHVAQNALVFPPDRPVDAFGRPRPVALPDNEELLALLDDPEVIRPDGTLAEHHYPGALMIRSSFNKESRRAEICHRNTRFTVAQQDLHVAQALADKDQLIGERAIQQARLERKRRAGDEAIELGRFDNTALSGMERTPLEELEERRLEEAAAAAKERPRQEQYFTGPSESSRDQIADSLRATSLSKSREKRRSALALKEELKSIAASVAYNKAPTAASRSSLGGVPPATATPLIGNSIFAPKTPTASNSTLTPLAKALMGSRKGG